MYCLILIFGESDTDSKALEHLIRAINISLPNPVRNLATRSVKKPIILSRNAEKAKLRKMSDLVAALYRAAKTHLVEPIAVVHQDCDELEPAHLDVSAATIADIVSAGAERVVAASAAWEIEAWWMLFPEALKATRSCWRSVNYGRRQVGKIANAKEKLRDDLRPRGKDQLCPDYSERDSPNIARNILQLRLTLSPLQAKSESFDAFYTAMRIYLEDTIYS